MNEKNFSLAETIITKRYVNQAKQSKNQLQKQVTTLLSQRKLPEIGWNDYMIEYLLNELSQMDSNNFQNNVGLGEREGRVYQQSIVAKRHFNLAHGVGRSGDIQALQPKAAGSSLLAQLCKFFVLNIIHSVGIKSTKGAIILPLATGMGITMTLLTLRKKNPTAKYIIWSRIDQKTCFKAIFTAGYTPIIIEPVFSGDELQTDLDAINETINEYGAENILCIITTTSCFAPRGADKIVDVALICENKDIPHVINNAYGITIKECCKLIERATNKGRVDCFIQSTDKNFMVPVGGSIIASRDSQFIDEISQTYPGRASATPVIDLFITLLSMGLSKYKALVSERSANFDYLKQELSTLASKFNERVLDTPNNHISLAMTLDSFDDPTLIGSMLFSRCCSGARIIKKNTEKTINGVSFIGYGAHCNNYPSHYMTTAAAIGMERSEIDIFMKRLEKVLKEYIKKKSKSQSTKNNNNDNNNNDNNDNNDNDIKKEVFEAIQNCESFDGITASQISEKLNLDLDQVKQACEDLFDLTVVYQLREGYYREQIYN